MSNKNKNKVGVVYSTDPNFNYAFEGLLDSTSSEPIKADLRIRLDRKAGGKVVTTIEGFTGKTTEIEDLAKQLKTLLGVGGAVKDRQILLQGDFRDRVLQYVIQKGFKAKKAGG